MKILLNDIIQYSDAPDELKSPALADFYYFNNELVINLDKQYPINSIGLGNLDKNSQITVLLNNETFIINYEDNGLYLLLNTVITNKITINTTSLKIGRFAAGFACDIPTAVMKEPGWGSTAVPRTTLSGQVIAGRGGYNYRTLSLDSRYKITKDTVNELEAGQKYIGMGYPFFLNLEVENYKIPYKRFYGIEKNQQNMILQSGVRKFLYSFKFDFEERF